MEEAQFDVLIIGSGAGGAAAAYRLVVGGLRVALFEKGRRLPRDGTTLDIEQVVHQGRFRSRETWVSGGGKPLVPEEYFNVGGKTKWYGAALLRFSEREFEPDVAHSCRGWPIARHELLPFYEEAEQLLGVKPFACETDLAGILQQLSERRSGWQSDPIPMGLRTEILQDPKEGAHFDGFASVRGLKGEAEASFLARIEGHPNFRLFEGAEVSHLIGSGLPVPVVEGVELVDGQVFRAPLVFLAAGALHSPRLLERFLRAAGLEDKLPAARHVGRNLKLHLLTAMVSVGTRGVHDLIRKTVILTHERFAHSSVQPLGFDGELIGTLVPGFVPPLLRRWIGAHAYGFFLQTEDGSHPDNRVGDARDGSRPLLDFDESRVPAAAREHAAFCRGLQSALFGVRRISFTKRIQQVGTAHACGTLVCGHDASDSVVDARGQVHGLRGLVIVDGSVLPRSSRVNPSLTIYAWALRAATLVLQDRGAAAGIG